MGMEMGMEMEMEMEIVMVIVMVMVMEMASYPSLQCMVQILFEECWATME